ncbi:MAG: tRNA dihydrouridine synthase DusB [Gammaproteobacteria bacterium]|nr:tRNA dihydrouridine synthase DusB [Gammaproteobacteria bacterium]
MKIGPYTISGHSVLAPMAGISDKPFRLLCRRMGAGLATTEMITSESRLWRSVKSRQRLDYASELDPISVQIVGSDPALMADSARRCVDLGAQIIDINMGCPAKKVCSVAAGSALLRDEELVSRILDKVVNAVDVPVTLKIRTGWDPDNKNAVTIAKIAEQAGVQALTVHGRTRACAFKGGVEYETIADVKQSVSIPVIANGDITTPEIAKHVLEVTRADAVMLGRAAQGSPWIFDAVNHFIDSGEKLPDPAITKISGIVEEHLERLYEFYGEFMGVRIARKHIAWYCKGRTDSESFWLKVNKLDDPYLQLDMVKSYFREREVEGDKAA